jgi:hypothetical protein
VGVQPQPANAGGGIGGLHPPHDNTSNFQKIKFSKKKIKKKIKKYFL